MNILLNTTLVSLTLIYTFYLGFNDGANAVASTITTHNEPENSDIARCGVQVYHAPYSVLFLE